MDKIFKKAFDCFNVRAYTYVLIIVISLTLYIVVTNIVVKIFFMLLALWTLIFFVVAGVIYLIDKAEMGIMEWRSQKMKIKEKIKENEEQIIINTLKKRNKRKYKG